MSKAIVRCIVCAAAVLLTAMIITRCGHTACGECALHFIIASQKCWTCTAPMTRGSLSWLPQLDVAVVDDGFSAKDIDVETRRGIENYNNLHLPRPDTLRQATIRRAMEREAAEQQRRNIWLGSANRSEVTADWINSYVESAVRQARSTWSRALLASRAICWSLEKTRESLLSLLRLSSTEYETLIQDLIGLLVSVDADEINSIFQRYESITPLRSHFSIIRQQQLDRQWMHLAADEKQASATASAAPPRSGRYSSATLLENQHSSSAPAASLLLTRWEEKRRMALKKLSSKQAQNPSAPAAHAPPPSTTPSTTPLSSSLASLSIHDDFPSASSSASTSVINPSTGAVSRRGNRNRNRRGRRNDEEVKESEEEARRKK